MANKEIASLSIVLIKCFESEAFLWVVRLIILFLPLISVA